MTFTLRADQRADVDRFLAEPTQAGLNASVVGTGKTAVSVQSILESGARSALIVAPLNTLDGWQRAFRLQGDRDLVFLSAKHPERMVPLMRGEAGVRFIGWEWARSMNLDNAPVDFTVLDEVHRAQLRTSTNKQTDSNRLAMGLALGTRDRGGWAMGLSATPFGNKVAGAFGICHALWGERKDLAYHAFWPFVDKYLGKTRGAWSVEPNEVEYSPGLIARTMPLYWRHEQGVPCCRFHPRGVQEDLPPRVMHRVTVPLTPSQRKLYDQLEAEMFAWVEEHDVPIDTQGFPMVLSTRLRQICLAQPTPELKQRIKDRETGEMEDYVQMRFDVGCKSSKIEALREIISDLPDGERVVVFTHSAGIIPAVVAALDRQLGRGSAFGWHGGVRFADRQRAKEDFIAGGRVQVIVAQVNAIGEGIDGLQRNCATEVWLSLSSSGIVNVQARGRLSRTGQDRVVNVYSIEADNTIEARQLDRLERQATNMHAALTGR